MKDERKKMEKKERTKKVPQGAMGICMQSSQGAQILIVLLFYKFTFASLPLRIFYSYKQKRYALACLILYIYP